MGGVGVIWGLPVVPVQCELAVPAGEFAAGEAEELVGLVLVYGAVSLPGKT